MGVRIDGHRFFHLTGRVRPGVISLCEPEPGQWLWSALRSAFPAALATCLMPNHPHLVSSMEDPDAAAQRLTRLFGQFSRRFGQGRAIISVPPPRPIETRQKLARDARYIALNPCRRRLCDDPLRWELSTYRDVVGAIADPWVTAEGLASALGRSTHRFAERFHRYVSSDPHVRVQGTPFPVPALATAFPREPLQSIAAATVAANRSSFEQLAHRGPTRTLFVQLALDQGWTDRPQLARICRCTPRTIRNLASTPRIDLLAAGRLCLGDPRLWRASPHVDAVVL